MQKIILFFQNYSVALGTTVMTFLITWWVGAWSDRTAFALFIGAVLVSAYFQGLRAGALATALSAFFLICQYRLLPAESALRLGVDFVPSLVLFVLLALLAGYLARECLHAVQSAARHQGILANLRDALLLTDAQGQVTFMNDEAQTLTGWSMPEAGQTPIDKVLHLEDEESRLPIKNPVTRLLTPGKEGQPSGTALLLSHAGIHKRIEYRAKLLYKADSSIGEVMVVLRDIGEGLPAEIELKKRAEELDRKLAEEKQQQENLRQTHQDQESKAKNRIAELEKAQSQFQDQLGERRRVEEELRREHAKKQEEWKRLEEKLRQELAEAAGKGNKIPQDQQADWRRKEEELRREHNRKQEEWKQTEAQHRRELADLAEMSQLTEEELAKCREREASLQEELHQLQEVQQHSEAEIRRQWDEERALYQKELETLEQARKNAEFLMVSCQSLAWSHDYAAILKTIATSALSFPADGCVVYGPAEGLPQRVVAAVRGGPEGVQILDTGNSASPSRPAAAEIDRLIQEGQPAIFAPVPEVLEREITAALSLKEAAPLVSKSVLCLPISLEGQFTGMIALVRGGESHPFSAEDQVLAEEWLRQARQALTHAWTYAKAKTKPDRPSDGWDHVPERVRPVMGRLREAGRAIKKELKEVVPLAEPVGVLDDNIHRLSLFLDGLEVVNQLERGALALNRQMVDLSSVINRAVETVAPFYRTRGHHLTVSLPLEPVWFSADLDKLVLVLASLLDNTCSTWQSGGSVRLKVEHKPDAVVFRIQDDSHNIPAPVFPVASVPSGDPQSEWFGGRDGLILGLSLIRQLIEMHHGDIALVWEGPEGGREIVLQLPVVVPKPEIHQEAASFKSASHAEDRLTLSVNKEPAA